MNHVYMQIDGEWHEVGEPKELTITEEQVSEPFHFPIDCGKGYEFTIKLKRRQAQRLREAFGIKKYLMTEAKFPRKKRRGTMRRMRKIARMKGGNE